MRPQHLLAAVLHSRLPPFHPTLRLLFKSTVGKKKKISVLWLSWTKEGKPTADEDGEGSCGQRDDQRRAGEQWVDDPADALADDGLPNIWTERTHTEKTQEDVLTRLINVHECNYFSKQWMLIWCKTFLKLTNKCSCMILNDMTCTRRGFIALYCRVWPSGISGCSRSRLKTD